MPSNTSNANNTATNTATPANDAVVNGITHPAIPFPTGDNPPTFVEQVQTKTAEAVKPAVEKLNVIKEQAAGKLASGANQALSKLADHSEKLYINQVKLLDACRIQVRRQPMTMLGLAVATVVALGVLFRQSR
ncbi:hypothetical protein [Undibacterium sp. TC9W]|uniref:hypothetical protein n=1 Tax=Undibacterium sp. TC9W TaxID=3413053 RepID=UPI003BF362D5